LNSNFIGYCCPQSGPGSSVGIATGYGLDGPGIESRWEARFSAPVQTGAEAHPATELYLYSRYGPYGLYRASVPVQRCTLPLLLSPDICTLSHFRKIRLPSLCCYFALHAAHSIYMFLVFSAYSSSTTVLLATNTVGYATTNE